MDTDFESQRSTKRANFLRPLRLFAAVSAIILVGNSPIGFDNPRLTAALEKSPVHSPGHALQPKICLASI
jgi:riboflavin biosynthesis pyrimidine reductase